MWVLTEECNFTDFYVMFQNKLLLCQILNSTLSQYQIKKKIGSEYVENNVTKEVKNVVKFW